MIVLGNHVVEDNSQHRRMVDYCIGLFPQLPSRNAVKKALKKGELLLNGKTANTGTFLSEGDRIELLESNRKKPKQFPIDVPIVFEDDHLVVVNKPAGLVVNGNRYQTLENALVDRCEPSQEADRLEWVVPVHRLDGPTSGLVICAKTFTARIEMMKQFETRKVEKVYHAILQGKVEGDHVINKTIDGVNAISELRALEVVPSLRNGHVTLVELRPKTGRTHQLRVHCSGIGFPIIGDTLYGEQGNTMLHKGLFLTATHLHFQHPLSQVEQKIEIPVPYKFRSFMNREKERFERKSTS